MSAKNFFVGMLLLGFSSATFAQVTVQGPRCVLPGMIYQYTVKGNWSGNASLQVCITGGILADSNSHCRNGNPVASVNVVWDSTATQGSLSVNSSLGTASQTVTIGRPLSVGELDPDDTLQNIVGGSLPAGFHCAAATGGSCNPSYLYQWQHSDDAVFWTDTTGLTGQRLTFAKAFTKTKYYRLKVTETISGTVGYSRIAAVLVNTPSVADKK